MTTERLKVVTHPLKGKEKAIKRIIDSCTSYRCTIKQQTYSNHKVKKFVNKKESSNLSYSAGDTIFALNQISTSNFDLLLLTELVSQKGTYIPKL